MIGKNRHLVSDEPVEFEGFQGFERAVIGDSLSGWPHRWHELHHFFENKVPFSRIQNHVPECQFDHVVACKTVPEV